MVCEKNNQCVYENPSPWVHLPEETPQDSFLIKIGSLQVESFLFQVKANNEFYLFAEVCNQAQVLLKKGKLINI